MVKVPLHGPQVLAPVARSRDDLEPDEAQGVQDHSARARQPDPMGWMGRWAAAADPTCLLLLLVVLTRLAG